MSELESLMELSRQALEAANLLLKEGYLRGSQNRLYYSIYYAAKAALLASGEEPVTHRGIVSQFGQKFVKRGKVSKDLGRFLANEQRKRYEADYEPATKFSGKEVMSSLERTEKFINEMEKLIDEK